MKQGLYSPGLHIPVLAPAALIEQKIDYTVILAWQYASAIISRNQDYIAAGGRFIVPMPYLRIDPPPTAGKSGV